MCCHGHYPMRNLEPLRRTGPSDLNSQEYVRSSRGHVKFLRWYTQSLFVWSDWLSDNSLQNVYFLKLLCDLMKWHVNLKFIFKNILYTIIDGFRCNSIHLAYISDFLGNSGGILTLWQDLDTFLWKIWNFVMLLFSVHILDIFCLSGVPEYSSEHFVFHMSLVKHQLAVELC